MKTTSVTSTSATWDKEHVLNMTVSVLFDSGDLEVAAEFSTKDKDAAGSVDFVVLLNNFVISVLEVRMLFCHLDASFLCILKVGVNIVKSICGKQWLHTVGAPDWGNLLTAELYELYVSACLLAEDTSFQCTALG